MFDNIQLHSLPAAQEARRKIQSRATGVLEFRQLDITDASSIAALAAQLRQSHGGIDVLVNNAGIAYKGEN